MREPWRDIANCLTIRVKKGIIVKWRIRKARHINIKKDVNCVNLEILLSCMHQNDFSIITKSSIISNAIIINQCDKNDYSEQNYKNKIIRMISTIERGLSKSRNMAVSNSTGDICLICDDDESFIDGYESIIIDSYKEIDDADIIAFKIVNIPKKLKNKTSRINYFSALRLSSWQISFKRKSILDKNIKFDELLGAGTGHGAQEENKFLIDCLKKGLKIYYVPKEIATVSQNESTWFKGYDKKYFINRGAATRYMMGFCLSFLYGSYFIITKRNLYKRDLSSVKALYYLYKGIFSNYIAKIKNSEELKNKNGDG